MLEDHALYGKKAKLVTTYLPKLMECGDKPYTLHHNTVLNTGRVSYKGIIQLLPRKGGARECFVSRPGKVLYAIDYSGLEMVTHAQLSLIHI